MRSSAGGTARFGFGELGRILFQDRAHGFHGGIAVESALSGEHFVEDCTETENIGAVVGSVSFHLFRGHVADRAHDHAGAGCEAIVAASERTEPSAG